MSPLSIPGRETGQLYLSGSALIAVYARIRGWHESVLVVWCTCCSHIPACPRLRTHMLTNTGHSISRGNFTPNNSLKTPHSSPWVMYLMSSYHAQIVTFLPVVLSGSCYVRPRYIESLQYILVPSRMHALKSHWLRIRQYDHYFHHSIMWQVTGICHVWSWWVALII